MKKVNFNDKYYGIMKVKYKNKEHPVIMDWQDAEKIRELNKKWTLNEYGSVICHHKIKDKMCELYLHEIIMNFKTGGAKHKILHINKLGIDNRRENLEYDTKQKEINKNLRKKERIIEFTKESGIKASNIPTYVWYLNPDKTHGERFMINIGDYSWKTSSSSKLSLRYKLEEAKKYLRNLKQINPKLFEDYSMNGELNKEGKKQMLIFNKIIKEAGYTNIKNFELNNITDSFLKQKLNYLTPYEKSLLISKSFTF
jgi:hypothetical protein